MPTPRLDPREVFLQSNVSKRKAADMLELPKKGVDDLKFFAQKSAEGRPIRWEGLRAWFRKQYGLDVGRKSLARLATQNGVKPWWSHG